MMPLAHFRSSPIQSLHALTVTFVQLQLIFWTSVTLQTLQVQAQDKLQASPDCGTSKGCFSQCTQAGCDFTVSWNEDGNFGVYTLSTVTTETTPWMAIGFSDDTQMGGDSVSGCIYGDNNAVTIFNAVNTGRTLPTNFDDNDVTLINDDFQNGIFTCTIRRLKTASGDGKRFDITQDYFLFFASGKATNSIIGYHKQSRFFSPSNFSVTDRPNINLGLGLPPSNVGSVTLPSDCGLTRGCFSKCSGTACNFIVSWTDTGATATYTLTTAIGSSPSYHLLGMSSDSTMGGDSLIGCGVDGNGNIVLFSAETTGKKTPAQFNDAEVILGDSSFQDGILSCSFTRPTASSTNGKRFDINKPWILLFAYSGASFTGQAITPFYHRDKKFISSAAYSAQSRPNDGASDLEFPLIKVHGSLMIGAWIFFASIGIVAARYYKPVWTVSMCSQKVWFQLHRTCMVLVFCITVSGFIVIFVEVEGWSELQEPDGYLDAHPIMGVIVTALTVLNPLMAMFRPHPGTKNRPIFNWLHWFVGTSAHILGVITIFFGVKLIKADAPDYLVYILAGYVGWQVVIELSLEFLQCSGRKESPSNRYELDDMNNSNSKATAPAAIEESEQTLSIKRIILIVHIFVVGAVSATLIGLIAVGERELEE